MGYKFGFTVPQGERIYRDIRRSARVQRYSTLTSAYQSIVELAKEKGLKVEWDPLRRSSTVLSENIEIRLYQDRPLSCLKIRGEELTKEERQLLDLHEKLYTMPNSRKEKLAAIFLGAKFAGILSLMLYLACV